MFNSAASGLLGQVKNSAAQKNALEVLRAQAWYEGKPYEGNDPDHIDTDDDPAPRVISPLPRMIVDKGAGLLFGKPASLSADDDALQEFVEDVWSQNKLQLRLLGWARVNGYAGSGWLKFVHNPNAGARNPWPIQYYHRGYVEPTYDREFPDELIKIRITYRETDDTGKETWYREEWTADDYREWSGIPVQSGRLPQFDSLPATKELPNTYGEIPLVNWPNMYDPELDEGSGRGDLDGLFNVLHRINIAADGFDLALQLDAKGSWLAFGIEDGRLPDLNPGSVNVVTKETGFIKAVESGQPHLEEAQKFIKLLTDWVFHTARIVYLDPQGIHLGQLSSLAIKLIFGPALELTDEKRRNAGEALEGLFEGIARAASKMGKVQGLPSDPEVEMVWPELFSVGQDEIAATQANLMQAEQAGWVTAQESRQKVAQLWGIRPDQDRDAELDRAQSERLSEALHGPDVPVAPGDRTAAGQPDSGRGGGGTAPAEGAGGNP